MEEVAIAFNNILRGFGYHSPKTSEELIKWEVTPEYTGLQLRTLAIKYIDHLKR